MGSCHTPPVAVTACQQCGHSLAAHGPATCGVCSEEEGSGLRSVDQVCGRQPVPPSAKRGRESVRFLWIRVNRNDEESVAWLMKVILVFLAYGFGIGGVFAVLGVVDPTFTSPRTWPVCVALAAGSGVFWTVVTRSWRRRSRAGVTKI